MELKQFVADALVEICDAVDSAREQVTKRTGMAIAPGSLNGKINREPSLIEFDVSVVVSEAITKEGEGSAGVSAKISIISANVNVSGSANKASASESQQKIRFSVPVYFQALMEKR